MKKVLVVLAVAALTASMASADTNIVSGNVVGYGRVNVPSGQLRLIGCNFQTTSSSNSFSIQDLFDKDELFRDTEVANFASAGSDQISVWNGTTYDTISYGTDGSKGVWLNANNTLATKTFARGDAFWFKRSGPTTNLTLSGQAPFDGPISRTLDAGYQLFSYSFPKGSKLNELGMVARVDADNAAANSDQIMVFNGSTYDTYTYGYKAASNANFWLDKYGRVTSAALPVSTAAWFKRVPAAGELSWNENKPY